MNHRQILITMALILSVLVAALVLIPDPEPPAGRRGSPMYLPGDSYR